MPARRDDSGFSLGQSVTIAMRMVKSKAFIIVMVVGLGVTAFLAQQSRPIYGSETVLLYRPRASANLLARADKDESRRVALRVQDMLFERTRMQKLIEEFKLFPDVVASRGMIEAIEEMRRTNLKFDARDGSTFRISFEAESPILAQSVTARATDLVLQDEARSRKKDALEANKFLDVEKKRAEDELHRRETDLVQFLAQHPELATESAEGADGAGAPVRAARAGAERSGSDDGAMLGLEMQAMQLRDRVNDLNAQTAVAGPRGANVDLSIDPNLGLAKGQAERELAAAQRDLAEKQAQFTDEYPDVKKAKLAVEAARDKLRRTHEAVASATRRALESAPAGRAVPGESPEAGSLRRQIALIEQQLSATRARNRPRGYTGSRDPKVVAQIGTQYSELARRVHEARERHTLLEDKQFQASLQATLASQEDSGDLSIVEAAFLPQRPVRSNRMKIAAAGGGLSLILALALALLMVLLDDTVHAGFDLQRLGLPMLLTEVPRPSGRRSGRVGGRTVVVDTEKDR